MTKQELVELIQPKHQNQIQRVGFFVMIALCIVFVVLHNPLGGYQSFIVYEPCSVMGCEYYPISMWRSVSPVLGWFGYILHLASSLIATLLVGIAWLIIFRSHESNKPNKSA